ncbi:GTPase activating protein (GAP) for Rho1p, partial [Coemansia sp. RSA 1933]
MKSFRSRPQSDNLTDKRMALGCTSGQGAGSNDQLQQQSGGAPVSPTTHGKPGHTNSSSTESPLFGAPLTIAVRLAGVRVGRVAGNGEACVVPTVVAVCGLYLWQNGQQTQGIFRVNGSMKRVQRLQDEFNTAPEYGRHTDWSGYTLHDAATILRRYLISLPESVISVDHYSAFLEKLAEAIPDDVKARDYGTMIYALVPEARNTLLYILELLSVFARPENSARTLMNSSNLAAVLQPCLLVHPGHVADPQEYGKAKDVVEFLIANAPVMYPPPATEAESGRRSVSADEGAGSAAGLVVFESDECQGDEGYRNKFMASDDGTTLATGGATNPSAPATSTGQHNRWSSPQTRESALTVVQSSESMQQSQHSISMQCVSADAFGNNPLAPPPPRGDSLAGAGMVMSTPALGGAESARAPQTQSLDSVTARLYDPSQASQARPPVKALPLSRVISPDTAAQDSPLTGSFSDWRTNSGIALSSIQYQYTTGGSYSAGQSKVSPRPRRSISLATTTGLRNFARELQAEEIQEHRPSIDAAADTEMDAEARNIIDRSGMAVRARRVAGVPTDSQPARRPLPQVPVKFESTRTGTSVSAPLAAAAAGHGRRTFSAQSSSERVSALLQNEHDGNIYSLYPHPHGPKPVPAHPPEPEPVPPQRSSPALRGPRQFPGSNTKQAAEQLTHNQSQSQDRRGPAGYVPAIHQPQPQVPTRGYHGSTDTGSRHVLSWLSEDDPVREYEVIGGRLKGEPSMHMRRSGLEQGAAAAEAAVRAAAAAAEASGSRSAAARPGGEQLGLGEQHQKQKMRPIVNAGPEQIEQMAAILQERFTSAATNSQIGVPMEQYKPAKVPKSTESKGNKAGMSRLKTIFRIGHGSSAAANNASSSTAANSTADSSNTTNITANDISLPTPMAASMPNAGKGAERRAAPVYGPHPPVSMEQRRAHQELVSNSSRESAARHGSEPQHYIPRPPRQPNTADIDRRGAFGHSPHLSVRGTASASESPLGQAGRLQVAVPPGHLSFVYPDSPMSRTDTLGRSSVDSLTRKLGASGMRSSGRAYLVDPDADDDEDDDQEEEEEEEEGEEGELRHRRDSRADDVARDRDYVSPASHRLVSASLRQPSVPYGSHLHATPSNSTTLHSFSNMQQLQQNQHHHKRRSGLFDAQHQSGSA